MRRYYVSRNKPRSLTEEELYSKFCNLYLLFRDRDFFRGKAGITSSSLPDEIKRTAAIALSFQPFPITKWSASEKNEDNVFDVMEFLHDLVSKPEGWTYHTTETGFNYEDYETYNDQAGQAEFREIANSFLSDYGDGFELTIEGTILALGKDGIRFILNAEIMPFDEENVDSKVASAITKWRNRRLSMSEKRNAIRELADVFEWLKKTGRLQAVLTKKDEAAIFEIANNFAIRHHNPSQRANYDQSIWFSWIFHFYLATYHAAIRMIKREEKKKNGQGRKRLS